MVTLHPDYVIGQDKHTKAILLPLTEWEAVVEELEELDDIRAYDVAKASADDARRESNPAFSRVRCCAG